MSRKVDYSNLTDGNKRLRSDVKDWSDYINKNVAFYFVRLSGDKTADYYKIRPIKKQVEEYPNVKAIVLIVEDGISSMDLFESYGYDLNAPVVSAEAPIPMAFATLDIYEFPSVIFAEKSTITGAYSSIASEDMLLKAVDTFIGDNSVAHLDNN